MSPGERKLVEFIATRLESMLRRPDVWGSRLAVEEKVLQLIEIRRLLLDPASGVDDTRRLMRTYVRFIATVLPNATPEPLAIQLERSGREADFATLLKKFVDRELAEWVVEAREAVSDDTSSELEPERLNELESTNRLIELLRAEAAAEARHATRKMPSAIEFENVGSN